MKLIANKPMTYQTRRLQAGDEFEVNDRVGSMLVQLRKARIVRPDSVAEPPVSVSVAPPPVAAPAASVPAVDVPKPHVPSAASSDLGFPQFTTSNVDYAELQALRRRAEVLGIAVDKRWGARRLQIEIAARE